MSKVITFSRVFPAYHPRAGQPTGFMEKLLKSLYPDTTYYPVCCEWCGWMGMSCACGGGGQIADTGDYSDPTCPKCFSTKLEGDLSAFDFINTYYLESCGTPKHHTIRAGNRWKVGDKFSPRVWSGKPYASKQIAIAPDIEIKKIWRYKIDACGVPSIGPHNSGLTIYTDEYQDAEIAKNDGLSEEDLYWWLKPHWQNGKELTAQIICWNDTINY